MDHKFVFSTDGAMVRSNSLSTQRKKCPFYLSADQKKSLIYVKTKAAA